MPSSPADLRREIIVVTALVIALSTTAHDQGQLEVAQALDNALDDLTQALNTLTLSR